MRKSSNAESYQEYALSAGKATARQRARCQETYDQRNQSRQRGYHQRIPKRASKGDIGKNIPVVVKRNAGWKNLRRKQISATSERRNYSPIEGK
jgi:hypothetical protein